MQLLFHSTGFPCALTNRMASNFSGEGEHTPSPLVCTLEPPVVSQWTSARHLRATCVRWKPTEQLGTRPCRARNEAERAHKGIQAGARACTLAWFSLIMPAKFSSSSTRGRGSHLLEKKRGFASSGERKREREKEKERPALRLIRIFAACFRPSRTHRNFIVIALNFSSNSFDLFRAPFVIVFCDENNAHLDFFGLGKSFCVYLRSNYLILFDGRKFLWDKRCMSLVLYLLTDYYSFTFSFSSFCVRLIERRSSFQANLKHKNRRATCLSYYVSIL